VGLVFLLPRRPEGGASQGASQGLPLLALDDPPAWAVQRGGDEVVRCLDRLDWGGHDALVASQRALEKHRGRLAPVLLQRLRATPDDNPVLQSKLVELLAGEDSTAPGVLDELLKRALSPHPLVTKSALRVLAGVRDQRALDGIVPHLFDQDVDVRSYARGALAQRARGGESDSQAIILAELSQSLGDPDMAYLAVLRNFPDDAELRAVLQQVVKVSGGSARMVALASLLALGDPDAAAAYEDLLAVPEVSVQVDTLRTAATAGKVVGEVHWDRIARAQNYTLTIALAGVLVLAYDTGHPSAPHAAEILERIASDLTDPARTDVITLLYNRSHPLAVETTRQELMHLVGLSLDRTLARVIEGPDALKPGFAELALERLQDTSLRPEERGLLIRMLAYVAPERGTELAVRFALQQDGATAEAAQSMRAILPVLGPPGLARLAREIGTPEGNALFMEDAGYLGSGDALPDLQRLILDPSTSRQQREEGLDTLARLRDGPREETLRAVIDQLDDPALRERGRLLFWNYM